MHRRVLVLALHAMLAGCSGLVAPEDPTETHGPAPVPTPTTTAADPLVGPPAGVSADGIEDLDALLGARRSVVADTSHVWKATHREFSVTGDTNQLVSQNRSVAFDGEDRFRRYMSMIRPEGGGTLGHLQEYERYAGGDVVYAKWDRPAQSELRFTRSAGSAPPRTSGRRLAEIRRYLALENETVTRIDVGGRPHYEIRGTRSSVGRYGPVDTYEARAVVREDGLIRRLNVTFRASDGGQTVEVRYTSAYTRLGNATVAPPAWLGTARELTA